MESLFIDMSILFLSLPSYSGAGDGGDGMCSSILSGAGTPPGEEGSGSNSCLVSNIKITFSDTVTRTRNFKEAECAQTQSCPQIIFFLSTVEND